MNIQFKENQIAVEDLYPFQEALHCTNETKVQWEKALQNSLYTLMAYIDDKPIAMGRILGDGAICWYFEDIVVLPEYQGKGIGSLLVNRLLEYVKQNSIPGTDVSVFLMASKGKEGFYEKLGFLRRPHEYEGSGMELELEINEKH